jgi:ketosteroid isomerase-like protein
MHRTDSVNLITSKWEKDFSLEAKNKKAKKIVDVYAENALLQALPASFGTFQGKNNIRKFG